jgi:hypothetical protein
MACSIYISTKLTLSDQNKRLWFHKSLQPIAMKLEIIIFLIYAGLNVQQVYWQEYSKK